MAREKAQVPATHFALDAVRPAERFDLWRDSLSCLFEAEADKDIRRHFNASISGVLLGTILLARTQADAYMGRRSIRNIASDGLDHYIVRVQEVGLGQVFLANGGEKTLNVGDIFITELSRESRCICDTFSSLSLIIPRVLLEPLLKYPNAQHQRILPANDSFCILLRQHMQGLMQQSSRLYQSQVGDISSATLGLVAAALNGSLYADQPEQQRAQQQVLLDNIRRYVALNMHNPELTPAGIASAVGVSRSRLYQLTEQLGGVARYVRECRLRQATQLLLSAPSRSISDIAMETGFSSSSDFSRVFRKHFEMSPRDMRTQPQGNNKVYSNGQIDRRYEHWVRQL